MKEQTDAQPKMKEEISSLWDALGELERTVDDLVQRAKPICSPGGEQNKTPTEERAKPVLCEIADEIYEARMFVEKIIIALQATIARMEV